MLLCGAACSDPSTREVTTRLNAGAFGIEDAPYHDRVAAIGSAAREIVSGPKTARVGRSKRVVVKPRERTRAIVKAPNLPVDYDAHFEVVVQKSLGHADGGAAAAIVNATHPVRLMAGQYRLLVHKNGVAVHIGPGMLGDAVAATVLLNQITPGPRNLASESFRVPADATLELEYGIVSPSQILESDQVRFRAEVECDDMGVVGAAEGSADRGAPGWHATALALPRAESCHLTLSSDGPPKAGAVWAVPRVIATDEAQRRRPNVILISLDTLRADHLSSHGYGRDTSPHLDERFAVGGTIFRNAHSPYPLTSVAHLSLFTSLYAWSLPSPGSLSPNAPVPTLPERFRDAGYRTAAVTEDALLAGGAGFWFGFDQHTERPFTHDGRGESTFEDGIRFLREHGDERFFLFLHTYKTHAPYVSGAAYAEEFGADAETVAPNVPAAQRDAVDAYDRTIREVDDQVEGFLAELDRLDLSDDTIVVVVSDHGEAFAEHGPLGHGFAGHQEQLHVPFMIRGPGVEKGRTIDLGVSLVDVGPTLLELAGVSAPAKIHGRSLVPSMTGARQEPVPLFFRWMPQGQGVRLEDWKLLRTEDETELYDLETDPAERKPLEAGQKAELEEVLRTHDSSVEWKGKESPGGGEAELPTISPEIQESLKALGYL